MVLVDNNDMFFVFYWAGPVSAWAKNHFRGGTRRYELSMRKHCPKKESQGVFSYTGYGSGSEPKPKRELVG